MSTEKLERILVPTAMSDFSKAAARWAAMFHRRVGARITLLYANQPYYSVDILEAPGAYSMLSGPELRQRMLEQLNAFALECLPDCMSAVDTLVVDEAPAKAIIDTANKINADVILMGTHRQRGGRRRGLLGSVAESVVRETARPLMSVPASMAAAGEPAITKIVCAVNFTYIGRRALEDAVALAAQFGADVLVVHVAEPSNESSPIHLEKDFAVWVEPGIRHRCKYSQVIAHGDAAEQVLKIADLEGADLIVIGAQHKRFSDTTVIGTTTERIVRFARQPVWTVISRAQATKHDKSSREMSVTSV